MSVEITASQDGRELREAFDRGQLSLYLGAGVSVASGLPTWDRLVLSIYFSTISEQTMDGWRPFPNYLHAISDWYLRRLHDPLEITARKVRSFYDDTQAGNAGFVDAMSDAIYGVDAFLDESGLLAGNSTLRGVANLCAAKRRGGYGISSVITYNYDNLLELVLRGRRSVSVVHSNKSRIGKKSLPIFHVHGFVPFRDTNRREDRASKEIVFTEEEYNLAASDPYSWSNIVQLRDMSANVGLMVGLSLADRNIRRLLDALARSPVKPRLYALMKKPDPIDVTDEEIETIDQAARELVTKFDGSGIKRPLGDTYGSGFDREAPIRGVKRRSFAGHKRESPGGVKAPSRLHYEVRGIVDQVERLERERQEVVMQRLGITSIWYDDHSEIEEFLDSIAGGERVLR